MMEKEAFSSRLPGFYKLSVSERLGRLEGMCGLTREEVESLQTGAGLSVAIADKLVENAVGTLGLPMGVGLNFLINGRDYLVPMVVEEPSVVAAVSFAAKLARAGGGFHAEADESLMIAQVQVASVPDIAKAKEAIEAHREEILALADSFHPAMVARGGGARDVEVRVLEAPEGPGGEPIFVAQILIDKTKITPARILVGYVVSGVILTAIGLYEPIVKFGRTGATVPLSGFGYSIAKGVEEAVDEQGLIGAVTGSLSATSAGITTALVLALLIALIFKSKPK